MAESSVDEVLSFEGFESFRIHWMSALGAVPFIERNENERIEKSWKTTTYR